MTRSSKTRDNRYYLDRLRDEQPGVYADLQAGRLKNTSEALIVAGIRKPRTSFDILKSAWKKASVAERDAFKVFIGCVAPVAAVQPPTASVQLRPVTNVPTPAHGKQKLPPALAAAVRQIKDRRKLKNGQIMTEIGFLPLDASLGGALSRDSQIQERMVRALERWVRTNGASYSP